MTTTYTLPLPVITDAHRAATKNRIGGRDMASIKRAWHATDARCVTCLTVTHVDGQGQAGDAATFGHVIPASVITPGASAGMRGGYTPDNGVLMCADCQHLYSDTPVTRVYYVPTYFGAARFPRMRATDVADTDTVARKRAMVEALQGA
jgi:hypothetical protein